MILLLMVYLSVITVWQELDGLKLHFKSMWWEEGYLGFSWVLKVKSIWYHQIDQKYSVDINIVSCL